MAYEMYKKQFRLLSEYQDLSISLRQLMRDPFSLSLIAQIYKGQRFPSEFHYNELVGVYLDSLVRDERLKLDDLTFLKQDLMWIVFWNGCRF